MLTYHVERLGLDDGQRFGIFDSRDNLLNQFIFKHEVTALHVCELLNQDNTAS